MRGDGSVYTGFQAVGGDATKTLLDLSGYVKIEAQGKGNGEGVDFVVTARRPFTGQAQVTLGEGSVRLDDVALAAGQSQTISLGGATRGQVTLQLVSSEGDGGTQVLTATLTAGAAGDLTSATAQALLGTASS